LIKVAHALLTSNAFDHQIGEGDFICTHPYTTHTWVEHPGKPNKKPTR
jgi:hypothetical protein